MAHPIKIHNDLPALFCCEFCIHKPCTKLRFGSVYPGKFILVHRTQFSASRSGCPFVEKNDVALRKILSSLSAQKLGYIVRQTISLLSPGEKNIFGAAFLELSPQDNHGHIRLVTALALKGICSVIRVPFWLDQDPILRRWLLLYQIAGQKKVVQTQEPVAEDGVVVSAASSAATSLLPYIISSQWEHAKEKPKELRKEVATFADFVLLRVGTKNIEDGTYAYFDVYEGDPKNAKIVQTLEALVKNNSAEVTYEVPKDNPPTTKIAISIDDMSQGSDTIEIVDAQLETIAKASCNEAVKNDSSTVVEIDLVPMGQPLDLKMKMDDCSAMILSGIIIGKPVVPVMPIITFIVRSLELTSSRKPVLLKTPHEVAKIEEAALTKQSAQTGENTGTSRSDGTQNSSSAGTTAAKAPLLTNCAFTFSSGENRSLAMGDELILSCVAKNFNNGDSVAFDIVDENDAGKRIIATLTASVDNGVASVPWTFGSSGIARSVKIVFADLLTDAQKSEDTLSLLCDDGTSINAALSGVTQSEQGGEELLIADVVSLPKKLLYSRNQISYTIQESFTGLLGDALPCFSVRAHTEKLTTNICKLITGSKASANVPKTNESENSSSENNAQSTPVSKEIAQAAEMAALMQTSGIALDPELLEVLKSNKGRALIVSLAAQTDAAGDSLMVTANSYQKTLALSASSPILFSDIPKLGTLKVTCIDKDGLTYVIPLKTSS